MKKVSPEKYVDGVLSIYEEKPGYHLGHDGSDGLCDCIGMCRGGLERAGATDIKGLRGTNYAVRHTLLNVDRIESEDQLMLGDVVLKVRDKDDKTMPLPDQYRKGGSDYSQKWGETNFTHIGTVTHVHPLEITHMTSPTAKKDTSLKGWTYFGELPWVGYDFIPEPDPEPIDDVQTAIVSSANGKAVKMRAKPSMSCRLYWDVPNGSEVIVDEHGETWSKITWHDRMGYMLTNFLSFNETPTDLVTVIIPGLTRDQANVLLIQYPEGYISAG